jgi:hypothetical protein
VANVAYGERADVAMPAIQNKIRELEGALLEQVVAVDAAAKEVLLSTLALLLFPHTIY